MRTWMKSGILSLLMALLSLPAFADSKMTLVKDSQGIKVWTYEVKGYPIRGFKATTTVESSLSALVSLILDTDRAPEWIYRTHKVNVLKRDDNAQTFLVRVETDFPWPLKDRDAVVAGKVKQDPNTLAVSIQSKGEVNASYPPVPEFIRMPNFEGLWEFKPIGDGKVEVTMSGTADPAGQIPPSVVNLVISETPYRTIQGLKKMIDSGAYKDAALKQIKEPK